MDTADKLRKEFKVYSLSKKIKKLKKAYKVDLATHLGIVYFTLIGKVNNFGGFSDLQLTKIEEWLNESEKQHGSAIYKRQKAPRKIRPRHNREGFGRRKRVLRKRLDKSS